MQDNTYQDLRLRIFIFHPANFFKQRPYQNPYIHKTLPSMSCQQ